MFNAWKKNHTNEGPDEVQFKAPVPEEEKIPEAPVEEIPTKQQSSIEGNLELKVVRPESMDEIFTIDEVSGFPKGDIQYYLSPNGNPLVRQWLVNNLLKPRMLSGSSIEEISDDLRVEFSRGSDESLSDWQNRLVGLRESALAEYQKSLETIDK